MRLLSMVFATIWVASIVLFNSNAAYAGYSRQVITHHSDNSRSGWNYQEAILTPQNVASSRFGLLATVTINGTAVAQPLIAPNQQITAGSSPGSYAAVLYVATSTNWVYAIDASTGAILLSRNLGPYVTATPCLPNGGQVVGIVGTPVIDVNTHTLDLVNYTYVNGTPTYLLHALNLSDLTDTQYSPVTVAGSHTLADGTTFTFDARYQKQAPALLYSYGNIYVAFAAWCDNMASLSRGWVLGWRHDTLAPLPSNHLDNSLAPSSSNQKYLSSIWMSGAGPAADANGSLYFLTGNSKQNTYDSLRNLSESFVKLSFRLTTVQGLFTPSEVNNWDGIDEDFGSGGVALLPTQPGAYPRLATAAGKSGVLYLLNADNPGGYTPGGPDNVVDNTANIGACLCMPSYYVGADGVTHVVSSGKNGVTLWRLQTSPTTKLVQESDPVSVPSGQGPGFFTSVSSNGTDTSTGVIWAVAHQTDSTHNVMLYAYAAQPQNGALTQLFSGVGGYWLYYGSSNIVPVTANGKVYIGSTGEVMIFGLKPVGTPAAAPMQTIAAHAAAPIGDSDALSRQYPNQVSGTIEAVNDGSLKLKSRSGSIVTVDASAAIKAELAGAVLYVGQTVTAAGAYDKTTLRASLIVRAAEQPTEWPADH